MTPGEVRPDFDKLEAKRRSILEGKTVTTPASLAAAYAEQCVRVTSTGGGECNDRRYIAIVSPTGTTALMDEPWAGVSHEAESEAKAAIREMLLAFAADLRALDT